MSPVIVKVLEPIGFENSFWIDELRKEFPIEIEYIDTRGFSDEKLLEFVKEATALILSNRPLSRKVLSSCSNLKFISVAFTGIDHVDAKEIATKNIIIKNAAGYATHAVAELTIGLALQLYRKIKESSESITQENANQFPLGKELFGKTVGIIGGGSIGNEVARLFEAFGCITLKYRRGSSSLEKILKIADILSLHLPLSSETRHFINKERLSLMKPSAILINTARGPIIDQEALCFSLTSNELAGAALDVFDIEPPLPSEHPLLKASNVLLLTPHIGYRTEEAALKKASIAISNLRQWLQTKLLETQDLQ